MPSPIGPILVVGATGKQGGAVIRSLLARPGAPAIRALTRGKASPQARELQSRGVELFEGTLSDVASLKKALAGVSAAFLVTVIPRKGDVAEDQQGHNFIEAARATNLPFLVYTSVADVTPTCGVPHFETKAKVEAKLKESGLRHAVVAPAAFYDNFPRRSSWMSFVGMGIFEAGLRGKSLQMVATDDIGDVAAEMLLKPEEYAGRHIPLAGDKLTISQVRDTYARVEQRTVRKAWLPSWVLHALPEDFRLMFRFFHDKGMSVQVPEVRKEFPGMRSFEQYLREAK